MFRMSGALSAVYDFYRDKALVRDLNVRLDVREDTGVREVAGVPDSLQRLWSSRRAQITPRWKSSSRPTGTPTGMSRPRPWWPRWPSGPRWIPARKSGNRSPPKSCSPVASHGQGRRRHRPGGGVDQATARKWQAPKSEQTETEIVIMDEAGMTDRPVHGGGNPIVWLAGAKLVLVGDHAQLESPDARGSLRLMASHADTFELARVHRFAEQWERDASLRLRAGTRPPSRTTRPGAGSTAAPPPRTSSGPCASPWPTIWPAGGRSSWPAPTSGPPG